MYIFFNGLNQNFTRWSWMTSSPEMLIKKRINFFFFFFFFAFLILNKCSLNLVLRARLVCPTYCIPQPPSLQVRTYITSSDFQSKSELFTTANCLWLTEEIIVDWQIKWMQQMQLLALHLEILGYILFLLYGFLYFRSIGDLIGESLILRW